MEQVKYSLLLTVVNKGFADNVMIAARSAGAMGGTVVNARGTGKLETEKFFGVAIEPEKEIVLIITTNALRHDIMKAIYAETGLCTEGAGFCFSLPVEEVIGSFMLTNSIPKDVQE